MSFKSFQRHVTIAYMSTETVRQAKIIAIAMLRAKAVYSTVNEADTYNLRLL